MLAERVITKHGDNIDARLRMAFRLLTSRPPTPAELKALAKVYEKQRKLYAASPDEAKNLTSVGERAPQKSLDPIDVAATTMVVQVVLNFDEFVWKR